MLAALHGLDVPGFVIETTSLARAALAALGMHLNWLEARTGYLPAAWNVLWSLSVEEAFYLAFPLLCTLALATGERLLKLTLLLFVALGPFARVAFPDNEIWADHSYLSCLDGIAIGCLAALYSARARRVPTRLFMLCGGVLFALVFFLRKATYALGLTGAGLNVTALEIGAALLLIAWSRRKPSLEPPGLCLAFLRWMGVNSYEIYLTHMFPVMLLASVSCRNAIAADGWCSAALSASAALAVLLSALLGSLVARYYSTPMRRRLTQLTGGSPDGVRRGCAPEPCHRATRPPHPPAARTGGGIQWAHSHLAAEMMPHGHGRAQPRPRGDLLDGQPRAFQQLARDIQPGPHDPIGRRHARGRLEAAQERALAHGGARGQIGDPQGLVDTRAQRIEHRGQRTALFLVDRRLHELRLTALAMRRDHQPTRHLVGPGRPVIATQQVQAQIQARRAARRRQQLPSSTYSTSASTWMRGYRLRRASA